MNNNDKSPIWIGAFALSVLALLLFAFFLVYSHTDCNYVGYNSFSDSDTLLVLDTSFFHYVVSGINILLIALSFFQISVKNSYEDKIGVLKSINLTSFLVFILILIIAIVHTAQDLDIYDFGEAIPFVIFIISSICTLVVEIRGLSNKEKE